MAASHDRRTFHAIEQTGCRGLAMNPRMLEAILRFGYGGQHRSEGSAMGETRKLAAILVTDIVGFSRLASADEQRTLARLRALRGDLVDPAVAAHHGRIVKGTGDGFIV